MIKNILGLAALAAAAAALGLATQKWEERNETAADYLMTCRVSFNHETTYGVRRVVYCNRPQAMVTYDIHKQAQRMRIVDIDPGPITVAPEVTLRENQWLPLAKDARPTL